MKCKHGMSQADFEESTYKTQECGSCYLEKIESYLEQTRAALGKYGQHTFSCPWHFITDANWVLGALGKRHPCDCGLEAALAEEEQG